MPPCSHLEETFPSPGWLHSPWRAPLLCTAIASPPQALHSRSSSVTTAALSLAAISSLWDFQMVFSLQGTGLVKHSPATGREGCSAAATSCPETRSSVTHG